MTTEHEERSKEEALAFIRICYKELGKSPEQTEQRLEEVEREWDREGTYTHTLEELTYGSRMAWRNNSRCIGRLFWEGLDLFDARGADTEEAVAEALLAHMAYATNEGRVRAAITVFAPAAEGRVIRILNHQLVRYAGYAAPEGVTGDPGSVAFTQLCMHLGWRGAGTAYDILPLLIQINDRTPRWFAIPDELVLEVPLSHPENEEFAELGLRWYAVPFISDMTLDLGGLQYTAAPFNGWYMGTEIGARNLADKDRYNQLPAVAEIFGLDTSTNTSLWKDQALVELNRAVLHSYKSKGVSIVDHHSAAEQFAIFERKEAACGREVNGRWSWLIPPMSPATTQVWHKPYAETDMKPNYRHARCPYPHG
ncbi:hypothetical protein SY83_12360 [Paenibacillus swuensis]|uniref:Nitric oxide synthase oxygenase n=1 Tax=Paenibacillus swuensis TaxID=1178515 RepID=A0A172TJA9_9BACL|nr:nitric oxide synthase oxygenase [Paenibacillus swuensis]ANE46937.1 hypothetical protein SY83_12360 [Paenibacillus swuensis]